MLNTRNLKLLNQPSKKFRSRYIGPHKIITIISSQSYKLDLPLSMNVHHVFHIGLLKEFNSLPHGSEVPDDDLICSDDTFHVHSIIDHKIAPHPQTYA